MSITDHKVIILRGLSGSGKSTFADLIAERCVGEHTHVVSADHYFIGEDGVYRFDGRLLTEAHASCFREYLADLNFFASGSSDLEGRRTIVDNTNLTTWEISPYVLAAQALGVSYVIADIEADATPAQLARLNRHGLSVEKIEAQIETWASNSILPPWWNVVKIGRIANKGFTIRKKGSYEMFRLEEGSG